MRRNAAEALAAVADEVATRDTRTTDSQRKEIIAAVEKSRGNIASASRVLGTNCSTLYYRPRKHGLEHLLPTKVQVGGEELPATPATASSPGSDEPPA